MSLELGLRPPKGCSGLPGELSSKGCGPAEECLFMVWTELRDVCVIQEWAKWITESSTGRGCVWFSKEERSSQRPKKREKVGKQMHLERISEAISPLQLILV